MEEFFININMFMGNLNPRIQSLNKIQIFLFSMADKGGKGAPAQVAAPAA